MIHTNPSCPRNEQSKTLKPISLTVVCFLRYSRSLPLTDRYLSAENLSWVHSTSSWQIYRDSEREGGNFKRIFRRWTTHGRLAYNLVAFKNASWKHYTVPYADRTSVPSHNNVSQRAFWCSLLQKSMIKRISIIDLLWHFSSWHLMILLKFTSAKEKRNIFFDVLLRSISREWKFTTLDIVTVVYEWIVFNWNFKNW